MKIDNIAKTSTAKTQSSRIVDFICTNYQNGDEFSSRTVADAVGVSSSNVTAFLRKPSNTNTAVSARLRDGSLAFTLLDERAFSYERDVLENRFLGSSKQPIVNRHSNSMSVNLPQQQIKKNVVSNSAKLPPLEKILKVSVRSADHIIEDLTRGIGALRMHVNALQAQLHQQEKNKTIDLSIVSDQQLVAEISRRFKVVV